MSRPPWRAQVAGGVAVAVAAVAPVVAYVGNLGFAPLIAIAGAVSAVTLSTRRRPWAALALLLAVAVYAGLSYRWGAVRPTAFPRYHEVEQLTGLKLLLETSLYGSFVMAAREAPRGTARTALLLMGAGFALVAVLLLTESLGGAALYQGIKRAAHQATRPDLAKRNVARGAYALALLLWPLALALRDRRWTAVAAVAGLGGLAAAVLFRVDAPVAALLLSGAAVIAVRYAGPRAATAFGAAAAAGVLLAPWASALLPKSGAGGAAVQVSGGVAKASWRARLAIWRFVGERVRERPLGWGLDGSRVFPDAVPLHPHDMALQVWLELGVFGALAAAAFWLLVFLGCERLARRDRSLGAAATGSAVAYLVIGGLSFGVWQEWWLALGALAAAAVAWSATVRRASSHGRAGLYAAAP